MDYDSDETIVPPLIKLLEECQALKDTRIQLNLVYKGRTQLFTDISTQDVTQHLTRFISPRPRSSIGAYFSTLHVNIKED